MFQKKTNTLEDARIIELQEKIKYKFKEVKLLKAALIHKSYVGNLFGQKSNPAYKNNERLEFLGDSVLGYIVTDYIYKKYMNFKEGELSELRSHLVCKTALSSIAKTFELHKYMVYGNGMSEQEVKVNDSVLENAMEAIVGAIYLDGGIKAADKFVKTFIIPANEVIELKSLKDSKSRLQEILQANGEVFIEYIVTASSGPDHDKTFEVEVCCNGKSLGKGVGKNKKIAEQAAARQALLKFEDKTAL